MSQPAMPETEFEKNYQPKPGNVTYTKDWDFKKETVKITLDCHYSEKKEERSLTLTQEYVRKDAQGEVMSATCYTKTINNEGKITAANWKTKIFNQKGGIYEIESDKSGFQTVKIKFTNAPLQKDLADFELTCKVDLLGDDLKAIVWMHVLNFQRIEKLETALVRKPEEAIKEACGYPGFYLVKDLLPECIDKPLPLLYPQEKSRG